MKIATVLRSGGDYNISHVKWLKNQLPDDADVICFSDFKFTIPGVQVVPLLHDWSKCKGWWAKIELFRPDIKEDFLYLDLDTVIVGDVSEILTFTCEQMVMLSDFYRPANLMSSIMWIPHQVKEEIWETFFSDPKHYINHCKQADCWGDQGFIQLVIGDSLRWQDLFPGWFVSYKAQVVSREQSKWAHRRFSAGNGSLPDDARIVVFHGQPRPFHVIEPWMPPAPFCDTKGLPNAGVAL
ncbi:hypothetical protein [Leclercia adecarboxylata]|uniref:hypothetical protein n=1 Tax=Leclercia adecarboxylata TaxID=83655 RepID=UPI0013CA08FA|nr:hypothetical protein [Leclercia adecarboxylata]NEG94076.1 hypothetical protein [Leclercia adecarboxylata]